MPALPSVPNVLRVGIKHTLENDLDVLCHMYFLYSGSAPTSAQLSTACSSIVTAWGTYMKALAFSEVTLTGVTMVDLTSPTAGSGAATASTVGTRAGTTNAGQVAVLTNYAVARRYRGSKPRNYWPYLESGDLLNAQAWLTSVTATFLTQFNDFIAAIIATSPGGATIEGQVNVSYYENFKAVENPITGRYRNVPQLRVGGPVIDEITAVSVNPRPATIRRRSLQKR